MTSQALSISLIEPFYSGSHKLWADTFQKYSSHSVDILSLPGRFWKWRMHGGAISLADQFLQRKINPDVIIATDMLDLSIFIAQTRMVTAGKPVILYFHENQLTYPWSETDPDPKLGRDNHYAFINYTSALSADHIYFNSEYHQRSFLDALQPFLNQFPDFTGIQHIDLIRKKSNVLPLMLDLSKFHSIPIENKDSSHPCTFLWNHRWEYDKNPEQFFQLMYQLKMKNIDFRLIVLGEHYGKAPDCFEEAQSRLKQEIIHWGYADDFHAYARLLWQADVLPVTSHQDFFGASIVEAINCNTMPILPDRLAYPEHLPEKKKDQYVYHGFEDLLHKAENAVRNVQTIRQTEYGSFVEKYRVENLITQYDQAFSIFT